MKQYILKQDTPDTFAGAIAEWVEEANAYRLKKSAWVSPYEYNWLTKGQVTQSPEWFEEFETVEKPPLGIMPFSLHRELRYKEIRDAINRYIDAKMPIPPEWRNELQSLESWIYGKQKEETEAKCEQAFNLARVTLANGEFKYQDYFDTK